MTTTPEQDRFPEQDPTPGVDGTVPQLSAPEHPATAATRGDAGHADDARVGNADAPGNTSEPVGTDWPTSTEGLSPGERYVVELLRRTPAPESALNRLHGRLEADAGGRGAVDIAYTTVGTPVGVLLLASTEQGLVRVAYDVEDHDRVLQTLADALSPRILRVPGRLAVPVRQVQEYFARERTSFDLPLDLALSRGFRRDVQRRLLDIAYGSTRSYTEVAALVGSPKAVRAVGSACSTNPLPVVVPCHRVLRSDGTLGGYIGGLAAKTALLELEQAA